jgi:hypothetical protein
MRSLREYRDQYYGLDPSVPADPYLLDDIYTNICKVPGGGVSDEAAALALELARHPRVNEGDRQEFAYEAQERYLARNILGKRVLRGYGPDLARAHLPLVTTEDLTEGRELAIQRGSELMRNWRGRYLADHRVGFRGHIGYAFELGACLVTNALEPSLLAYPSLPRQDCNTHPVNGRSYKWDVTIESDGAVVEEGQYRVQVKSSFNAIRYHPDINVAIMGDLLPQKTDVYLLPELLQQKDGQYGELLGRVSGYIVSRLRERPPASRQMAHIR